MPRLDKPPEKQAHADEESEVADAIDDESFVAGRSIGQMLEPEADEQVGAKTHAFPSHEHEHHVVAEHQKQHGETEEVHEGEEARVTLVALHVPDGINVDEHAHARNHQGHDGTEVVEGERRAQVQLGQPTAAHMDPRPHFAGECDGRTLCGEQTEAVHRQQEAAEHSAHAYGVRNAVSRALAEEDIECEAEQGQENDPADPAMLHMRLPFLALHGIQGISLDVLQVLVDG